MGSFRGSREGSLEGSFQGSLEGSLKGSLKGSLEVPSVWKKYCLGSRAGVICISKLCCIDIRIFVFHSPFRTNTPDNVTATMEKI